MKQKSRLVRSPPIIWHPVTLPLLHVGLSLDGVLCVGMMELGGLGACLFSFSPAHPVPKDEEIAEMRQAIMDMDALLQEVGLQKDSLDLLVKHRNEKITIMNAENAKLR